MTKVITSRTVSPLTPEQDLYVQAWRAQALEIMPYMASALFSFRPVNSTFVDTYACDPQYRLYINFDNVVGRSARFNAEAWLHEASHILAGHGELAAGIGVGPADRKMWNFAADAAINDDLRDAGCEELADFGIFAKHLGERDYQSAVHYFSVIKAKQRAAQKGAQDEQPNGDSAAGQPQEQQGGGSTDQPSSGQGDPLYSGCGSVAGGEPAPGELGDDDLDGAAVPADGMEHERVLITTAAAASKHEEVHGRGSVPASFGKQLEITLEPTKTPWDRVLFTFVRRCVIKRAGDVLETHSRRDRRRMNEYVIDENGNRIGKLIVPGWEQPVPSVHFFRDVSASVGDRKLEMASNEVEAIARRLGIRGNDLLVSDIDTKIHSELKYRERKDLNTIHARGGTDMRKAIEHACDKRRKPSCIVIATDGETAWPSVRPPVPVIVLLIDARQQWVDRVPEWATKVVIEDSK